MLLWFFVGDGVFGGGGWCGGVVLVVDEMKNDEMEDLCGDVLKAPFGRADNRVGVGVRPQEIGKLGLEE